MSAARIREIFEQVVALPADLQDAALANACHNDAAVAAAVRRLLAADAEAARSTLWNYTAIELEAGATARTPDPGVGERLGAYRITDVIGAGGMGTVYRARRDDDAYEQDVAIKRVKRGMDADAIVARFRTERRILASLNHPNIARLFDGGTGADGLPYVVMEYVDGSSLSDYAAQRALSITDRVRLFLPVCAAVHYAHQRMVIHRDIKPGNILVTTDGIPKLLDFGIAKLLSDDRASAPTVQIDAALTVRYASPEQVRGETVTTASDVYSLGVCLHELLTGASPYRDPDRNARALMTAVTDEPPMRASTIVPTLVGDIDNIVAKALSKRPEDRYASADQFADDLRRLLDGRPVSARGDAFWYVASRVIRRHRLQVLAAAAVLITLVAGVVFTARAERRAARRFNDVRRLAHSVVFDYHDAIADLAGATAVRERLVRDALQYLDSLSSEADDPELRRELVDAYVRISNVQGNSFGANAGNTAAALTSATKAVRHADALIQADRGASSLRSAALAYDAAGGLLTITGALTGAATHYQRAVEMHAEASAQDPSNADLIVERAETLRKLAELLGAAGQQNLGRTAESIPLLVTAEALAADAAAKQPDAHAPQELGITVTIALAAAEASLGHRPESEAAYRRALARAESTAARWPDNQLYKREVSNLALRLGILAMDDRRFADAGQLIERSRRIMATLVETDPGNSLNRRNLGVIYNHLARAVAGAGRAVDALSHNRSAVALAEALSAADPTSMELAADLSISHRKMSDTLLLIGRPADALMEATVALSLMRRMAADPADAYAQTHLARALRARGDAQTHLRSHAAAVTDYREATRIFGQLADRDAANTVALSDLARTEGSLASALALLGRIDEARSAYARALSLWTRLKTAGALTAEDVTILEQHQTRAAALRPAQ